MHDWKRIVRDRIAPLRLEPTAESDLVEEFSQHLEDSYRELRSGGASDEEAYRNAISELDDTYPLRTESGRAQHMPKYDPVPLGDARTDSLAAGNFMEVLWRDLRYAVRMMRKSPLFVLFVVLTLGLGIGANTTVFTVINTLILNPLPVPDSSGLAAVGLMKARSTSKSSAPLPLSYADLKDYQARNRVFRSLGRLHVFATCHLAGSWRFGGNVQRVSNRQLLLDLGPQAGDRPLLFARRGHHAWRAPCCGHELRRPGNRASAARLTSLAKPCGSITLTLPLSVSLRPISLE